MEKEMNGLSIAGLLVLYKREEENLSKKCVEYLGMLSDEGKLLIEKECSFLELCKIKIALRISDMLT